MQDEVITETLMKFAPTYYCWCKEIGNKKETPHIHIFLYSKSPIRFTTLRARFTSKIDGHCVAHFEKAYGSIQENIDYIQKKGKWENTNKTETIVEGSFQEYGEIPTELIEKDAVLGKLLEQIKDGLSTIDIIEDNPQFAFRIHDIETIRQTYLNDRYSRESRDLTITYVYGASGVGKTYGIFNRYGAENICRITNYTSAQGGALFDNYDRSQDCLVFEEFHSQINIENMLNYCDVYPIRLPARYQNRVACFTKIFITSNEPFENQYVYEKLNTSSIYYAWCRRVHNIVEIKRDGSIIWHKNTKEIDIFKDKIIKKEEKK